MPLQEAPSVELGSAPPTPNLVSSPSLSEVSSASSPEPHNIRPTPLFRALAMPPPEPDQPAGQDILERRLPGYRRIVIPRELTLIELLKQDTGVTTDEEVLLIRQAKLKVVAERVGLRRLHVLAPRLRSLTLDGSALSSLRDLGIGLVHLKVLSVNKCGLTSLDGVWGLSALRELHAAGNRVKDLYPVAALQKLHTLNMSNNPIEEASQLWTLGICSSLRNLILVGTPASNEYDYRTRVATALPMLIYLDDRPMHNDVNFEALEGVFGPASSSSDSGESDVEGVEEILSESKEMSLAEVHAGPSNSLNSSGNLSQSLRRRRPATTEGAGARPTKPDIPPRPRTAVNDSQVEMPSRLEIMNSLMDEEWRCSGSRLTSNGPVCGNLARALKRPSTAGSMRSTAPDSEMAVAVEEAASTIAADMPKAPLLRNWTQFSQNTEYGAVEEEGLTAVEHFEYVSNENKEVSEDSYPQEESTSTNISSYVNNYPISGHFELIGDPLTFPTLDVDVDTLYNELNTFQSIRSIENRLRTDLS